MYPKKGDLVLVSDGERTTTCIVLTTSFVGSSNTNNAFYYSYCLEDGIFGLIYSKEILSIVAPNFAPDFEFESDLFETDYSYYNEIYQKFAYFPSIFSIDDEIDDE